VTRTSIAEFALVAIAVAIELAPLPAPWIERWYSVTLYPHIERGVTPLSNLVPFALFDVLLFVVAVMVIVSLARATVGAWRARSVVPVARTLLHVAAGGAVLYVLFLALWGLNYRRIPMRDRLVIDRSVPSTDDVVQLGLIAVRQINDLYASAHASNAHPPEWEDPSLRVAFGEVEGALSDAPGAEPGRLKRTLVGPYFRWTGVDGMVNPFGLEVLVNPGLLQFERPFVAAHEWAHLAGYADESEANFIGWLTCIRASRAAQYSGWFFLYWQIAGEVDATSRARINMALADGPRRDINAVIARLRRDEVPALQAASWRVYDKYLKANRVAAGVRSYGLVIDLILRARYAPGWTPLRRGAASVPSSGASAGRSPGGDTSAAPPSAPAP
jgi:hypothetical protein